MEYHLPPHRTCAGSPAGYCHARRCSFCQGTQARGGEGNTAWSEELDHGTRAAGSSQEAWSGVRARGWSHMSPATVMQTVCRPTPEPNAAADWVKNSLPSLPTPFSAGLFLTQNIYGAWFTAEPPPHCTHQDESTQRSSSTTEPLSTACSHPACCTEAEDLGSIWQHAELSSGGHNGVFLCLMETRSWERSKLRRSRAALPHTATELRLVATPVWRLGRGTVELRPSLPMLSLGEVPWGGRHIPLHAHRHQAPPHLLQQHLRPPPQG